MDFNLYQEAAKKTAIYPEGFGVLYPVLGLANEAGEVAGKLKKIIRDQGAVMTPESKEALAAELGDVLWYLAAVATDIGYSLGEIAESNLEKLRSRQDRGVLGGSGDKR